MTTPLRETFERKLNAALDTADGKDLVALLGVAVKYLRPKETAPAETPGKELDKEDDDE